MPNKVITPKWGKFIRENRLNMSSAEMAKHIGCSRTTVQIYIRDNNLQPPNDVIKKFRSQGQKGRTSFTKEQTDFLRINYLTMPVRQMARQLKKSPLSVNIRMRQLGLIIPKEIREERKLIGRFKKGDVAHNKGKKMHEFMSKETMESFKKNQFKKGHKPHNYIEFDFPIRIRYLGTPKKPYKFIRKENNEWEAYNRYLYKKHIGPISDNELICFKDGDTLNCDLNNLEAVSYAENVKRIANDYHALPNELKRIILMKNKLFKTLKKNEHSHR